MRVGTNMKRLLPLLALAVAGGAIAQDLPKRTPVPIQFKIRHADPWFIKGLLEGQNLISPELSTIIGFMGFPEAGTNAVNRLFTGGRLVVNPTDNSLWFFPDWER